MTSSREMTTLSEVLADRDTLVLSPHMDDAMLSASSVVLDHPCDAWTVFTAAPIPPQTTTWDTSCGFPDSDATIAARKIEDAGAFEGTPARVRHLEQLEGAYATRQQHRAALPEIEAEISTWMRAHPHGVVIAPACAGLHMPPPVWAPALTAAHSLKSRVRGRAPAQHVAPATPASPATDLPMTTMTALLASPEFENEPITLPEVSRSDADANSGGASHGSSSLPKRLIGGAAGSARAVVQRALHAEHLWRRRRTMGENGLAANPDHLALRDLTLKVAARHPGVRVVLFEDLPYLWHARGDAEVARLERALGVQAQRVSVPVDVERKHAHLAAYTSQLPVLDRQGRLEEARHLPTQEVFWVLDET